MSLRTSRRTISLPYDVPVAPQDPLERAEWCKAEIKMRTEEAFNILFHENTEWEICKQTEDVTISRTLYRESPQHFAFRSEFTLNLPMDQVGKLMHSFSPLRYKWESNLDRYDLLEEIDESRAIMRSLSKSRFMGLITPRDAIEIVQFWCNDQGRFSTGASIIHPDHEPTKGAVRAWSFGNLLCLHYTQDANVTRVTELINLDARMNLLPATLVEKFMPTVIQQHIDDIKKMEKSKIKYNTVPKLIGWP